MAEPPRGGDTLERLSRELDWNLLRTFTMIAKEGGITRAADRLLLRQPTVSNALKRLESRLGRRLIERGRGRFALTAAGEVLYGECIEIYGNISRLAVVLRDAREEISGHIQVAMATHVVCPFYDEVLTEFHERNPKVTFRIDIRPSVDVVRAVLQKTASFGICLVYKPHAQLGYELIYRERFGFFCGPRHRFFGRRDLTLRDLRNETFVSFQTDHLTDALRPIAVLRAREGIEDRIVGISPYLEEVRRMIVAGFGIGPLPIHVVERDVRDGLLWQLPPYDDPPRVDGFLVTNPRAHLNRAEESFLETLRARIAGIPESERSYPVESPRWGGTHEPAPPVQGRR